MIYKQKPRNLCSLCRVKIRKNRLVCRRCDKKVTQLAKILPPLPTIEIEKREQIIPFFKLIEGENNDSTKYR
jgi:predicted amidophosphoribosyltransferase